VPDVVVTHANFDHYSGLPDSIEQLGVERVWVTRAFLSRAEREPRGAAAACLDRVRAAGAQIHEIGAGDGLDIGHTRFEVLSPPRTPFPLENDNSLVALVSVETGGGERRALFCGDIQRGAMAVLMGAEADIGADILELPHHGSVHAAALEFVELVDPGVVLQSTGPSRAREILWNELRQGRAWWMTAEHGAAWVEVRDDGSILSGPTRR
jgi:competence protein ComEC